MTSKRTLDERFLVRLYEVGGRDPMDYLKVAHEMGIKESALKNIIKLLAQANFIKKLDGPMLKVTERGEMFVLQQKETD